MRLTLRTMLAYLEDLLEPADAEQVHKKIEESEFATSLMHRTRDVTRRLRLGAPKLHGRGMGFDPNTVAEYLDYTLPSERVPDFEKVCLESDVHLAEVASCHQILALVLSKPAEIEGGSRQRMYELLSQADATAAARTAAKSERTLAERAARSSRRKKKRRRPKVPDYLREASDTPARSRPWAVMLLAALVLLAAGIGVASFWPQISAHFRNGEVVARVEPPDHVADVNHPPENAGGVSAPQFQNQAPSRTADQEKTPSGAQEAASSDNKSADNKSATADRHTPPEPSQEQPAKATKDANAKPTQTGNADESTMPEKVAAESSAAREGPQPARPGRPPAASDEEASHTASSTSKRPVEKEPADEGPASEAIGRLITDQDVLLRLAGDDWQRVAARGTVHAGERLIGLPTYRPSVTMSNGVTLQFVGGAIAALGRPDADGTPEIRLTSGRLLLLTVAKPDTKIRLQAGDYAGTIEFGKEEAALAIEVRPLLPEGANPEEEAAPAAVDLYLASGQATWTDRKGRSDTMSGRAWRSLGSAKTGNRPAEELPIWIEDSELNPTDRRASEEIEKFLRADKPATPALTELATHRKIENSLLATQSLALIDEFGPIIPLLNDKAYRIAWTSQIESLRSALARGTETAALVRQAFESARGKAMGSDLYRMLWGYDSQQLEDGAAAQLIEWLDAPDEQLDYRVLSFWNLHHITGLGLYYQPGDPEKQRRTSIQRWKQKLESGLIVPKAA
ncbi:MAG TPA: hypothetical protein VNH11_10600 [Pirellulales bacterium]|nr:hypothetical protein [Pirellulales bacterium]